MVGAALLGRRAAAERGRRRGGDVRVAVQPGAARAGVRGAVRGARVGVPRLPLRLPHPVRPPARSLSPILCLQRRAMVVRFDAAVRKKDASFSFLRCLGVLGFADVCGFRGGFGFLCVAV